MAFILFYNIFKCMRQIYCLRSKSNDTDIKAERNYRLHQRLFRAARGAVSNIHRKDRTTTASPIGGLPRRRAGECFQGVISDDGRHHPRSRSVTGSVDYGRLCGPVLSKIMLFFFLTRIDSEVSLKPENHNVVSGPHGGCSCRSFLSSH